MNNVTNKEAKEKLKDSNYNSLIDDLNRTHWISRKIKLSKKVDQENYYILLTRYIKKKYNISEIKTGSVGVIKTKVKTEYTVSDETTKEKIVIERIDEHGNLYQTIFWFKKSFFFSKPYLKITELTKSTVIIYGYQGTKYKVEAKSQLRRNRKELSEYIKNNISNV